MFVKFDVARRPLPGFFREPSVATEDGILASSKREEPLVQIDSLGETSRWHRQYTNTKMKGHSGLRDLDHVKRYAVLVLDHALPFLRPDAHLDLARSILAAMFAAGVF